MEHIIFLQNLGCFSVFITLSKCKTSIIIYAYSQRVRCMHWQQMMQQLKCRWWIDRVSVEAKVLNEMKAWKSVEVLAKVQALKAVMVSCVGTVEGVGVTRAEEKKCFVVWKMKNCDLKSPSEVKCYKESKIQRSWKLWKELKCRSKTKLFLGNTPLTVRQNELLALLTLIKTQFDFCLGNQQVLPQPVTTPSANLLPFLGHLTEPLDDQQWWQSASSMYTKPECSRDLLIPAARGS